MKNKNLILTISSDSAIDDISFPTFQNYANKINADFLIAPANEEKYVISKYLKDYERITYLDNDIIIRGDTPNIFDTIPFFEIGMFNEGNFSGDKLLKFQQDCHSFGIIPIKGWDGKYYNTGVIVFSRAHLSLLKNPDKNMDFTSYINVKIALEDIQASDLKYWFNRMPCIDPYIGESRLASYIIHYENFPNQDILPNIMKQDLASWDKKKPYYSFKRHIFIYAQGDMSDQLSAEPAIRYLLKYIYPHDDVRLMTNFPRFFRHLNIPVSLFEEMPYSVDVLPWQVSTIPAPDSLSWSIFNNIFTHTVDICSMALLKRTIPDQDKTIQLKIGEEDIEEINSIFPEGVEDLVLVHPGEQVEWWQELVDQMIEKGLKVCLIGDDSYNKQRVEADVSDVRNLLSLGGLMALISKSKVLVSDDSVFVRIAGAFDNYIVAVSTFKHPDYILPYRNGMKNYKAFGVYSELGSDKIGFKPTALYIENENPEGSLPEIDDVLDKILEIN